MFDSIDHSTLFSLLRNKYGLTGQSLGWFTSYLTNRSQSVVVRGKHSDTLPLPYAVARGSCTSPVCFPSYLSPMFDIVSTHQVICESADDTQVYKSFRPGAQIESEATQNLENCIDDIRGWLTVNWQAKN